MTVFHTKAPGITSLDSSPPARIQAGKTGEGRVKVITAVATPTASAGIDTTVQMVRVPSNAIIQWIEAKSEAQDTTGQFDIGAYYATDGSCAAGAATLLASAAIDQDFFVVGASFDPGGVRAYVRAFAGGGFSIINATPALFNNTAWAVSEYGTRLWEALGLSADPQGNIDICLTVVEAPGASTVPIRLTVGYTE